MANAPMPPGPSSAPPLTNPCTPESAQTSILSCAEPYETWDDPKWSVVERPPADRLADR
jgi:hypothetical protein